jgi:hypothetical protein
LVGRFLGESRFFERFVMIDGARAGGYQPGPVEVEPVEVEPAEAERADVEPVEAEPARMPRWRQATARPDGV